MKLTVNHNSGQLQVASLATLMLIVLRDGQPRVQDLEVMELCLRKHQIRHPQQVTVLTILCRFAGVPTISDEYRQRAAQLARVTEPHTIASALVLEGSGLQTSLVRSVITFIHMFNRSSTPQKLFSNETDALAWLAHTPKQVAPLSTRHAEIAVVVREFVHGPTVASA